LGGFVRDSITKKCKAALGNIIDGLDDDKDGRVNIDTFVHFMASHDIIIDPYEVQEMQDLADEKGEHSWFWNDLEHQAEDIFRESNKAAVAFNATDMLLSQNFARPLKA
jgi:hypothetical protein